MRDITSERFRLVKMSGMGPASADAFDAVGVDVQVLVKQKALHATGWTE